MPSISAAVVPEPGYVIVETSWADVPAAAYVCVDRVDSLTGATAPLRPYVAYNEEGCLALSCGTAIFWDTEAPLDRAVSYCATARDSAGNPITTTAPPLILDTGTRVVANGFGTPDIGPAWTTTGGAAADYSVTGTRLQMAVTSTGVNRIGSLPLSTPNVLAQVTLYPTVVALTQPFEQQVWLRGDAAALNGYRARVRFTTAGLVDLIIERVTAGVGTTLAQILGIIPYNATTAVALKFQSWASRLSVKLWDLTAVEPGSFQILVSDSTYSAPGTVNWVTRREAGNTNGTINMQADDLIVSDVCATTVTVQTCSQEVVVPSNGCFRLGDPVRPCHDRIVCLQEEGPCADTSGVFFGSMAAEGYASNTGLFSPVNARRPIAVSRNRRDVASTLVLVTRTFGDRDDVLTLNEPGSPLLWRGPAQYGIPDRYMSVQDVDVERSFLDHREEPRVITMPHVAVDAPVGPSTGVCGTRVMDLCDVYATWDAAIAAGVTYAGILRGQMSSPANGGIVFTPADWDDVDVDFVDWDALDAAEDDWDDTWLGFP